MMNHTKTRHFKKLAVVAVAVATVAASAQATVISLSANAAGSTAQWPSFSVAGTLNDGFAYDEKNPTATSPSLAAVSGSAAHGAAGTNGVDAVFAYSANHTVLSAESVIVVDVWGRDVVQERDNNFSVELDISLAGGGTTTVTATGGNIPDTPAAYQRLTFSGISVGDTINAMRIIGVDTDGNTGGNYFTIMETRLAAIPAPKPIELSVQASITYSSDGTQKALSLPFSNAGISNPLTISSVTSGGNDAAYFTVNSFTPSVATGAGGTVNFTFNPTDGNRDYYATLTIASNDPDAPSTVVNIAADVPREVVTLPGTGDIISNLTFEGFSIGDSSFSYNTGWAGSGYGLSGTQRGAPEYISIQATPGAPTGAGANSLCFYAGNRDAAWYTLEPEAVGQTYYGNSDGTDQDDFFLYGGGWTSQDRPSVMMHIYMDPYTPSPIGGPGDYRYSSIRMPVKYDRNGTEVNSWPGIWLYQTDSSFYLRFRRPFSSDYTYNTFTSVSSTQGQWFTLGLTITEDGNLHYFGVDKYVTSLKMDHYLTSTFALRQSTDYPITRINDATLMTSNFAHVDSKTYFDSIKFTRGAYTPTSLGAWLINTFGSADAAGAGALDDPDKDGRTNFYEYAFGTDPNNPNEGNNAVVFDGSKMTFNRLITGSVAYILEESTTLAPDSWKPVDYTATNVISSAGDYETVEMTKTNGAWLAGDRIFFRVRCEEK